MPDPGDSNIALLGRPEIRCPQFASALGENGGEENIADEFQISTLPTLSWEESDLVIAVLWFCDIFVPRSRFQPIYEIGGTVCR